MANTAFLAVNTVWGNTGQAPPGNALVNADMVVKDEHGAVVYTQGGAASAQLETGDTWATVRDKLTASARALMGDQSLIVVIL